MRRRELMLGLGGALVAARGVWAAQQAARRYRIAVVAGLLPAESWRELWLWRVLLPELRNTGYVEGENLTIEAYSGEGRRESYDEVAREVVSRKPDLIIAGGNSILYALKSATRTIPIVAVMGDPLTTGLAGSLARPGDNFTGVSVDAGMEIYGKRLQLLKTAVPSATRVANFATRAWQEGPQHAQMLPLQDYARGLGVTLLEVYLRDGSPPEVEAGFAALAGQAPDALLVSPEAELTASARLIVALAEKNRLPAIYASRSYIEGVSGGLMAYVPDPAEMIRYLADQVRRILAGAKPGDIPIYQATRFELIVNLKAARAIGLTIPQSLLARADEVIE